jgi:hypothetical protein
MQDRAQSAGADQGAGRGAEGASGLGLVVAFTATTFLSALLLFSVQPMFAKMVLPVLGGAPSVWAVAMCFFQAALLVGYGYAHLLKAWVPIATAGFVHLALSALAFLVLPIALPESFGEPPPGEPYLWQLGLFTIAVGLPFVAVSANAPLLQSWFAASGHPEGRDPYFMYGASNLGSLIALLGYPFVLEPVFGLKALSGLWTMGYAALVAAIAVCFLMIRAPAAGTIAAPLAKASEDPAPRWLDRLAWVGLALVPSALLTAFTTHLATDIASAPLIWVFPLAAYLLTFVLVFRERPLVFWPSLALVALGAYVVIRLALGWLGWTLPPTLIAAGIVTVCLAFAWAYERLAIVPMRWMLMLHLAAVLIALLQIAQTRHEGWFVSSVVGGAVFITAAIVAHRTLYEARPAASHLTEFYLWMSLGGVLGGLFAALIAPKLFSEVFEYPLLLALTMACRPGAIDRRLADKDELLRLWLILAAGILAVYWVPWILRTYAISLGSWGMATYLSLGFALLALAFFRHPARQVVAALLMFATVVILPSGVKRGEAKRSYFGVYRVMTADNGNYNILTHGTTLHGAQRVKDESGAFVVDTTPATYYHPKSPMAKSVEIVRQALADRGAPGGRFGVIGLGTGSLACYSQEGERWRFFEIDPTVVGIAKDPEAFSFIHNCLPEIDIVLGDARLTIAKEADQSFDLIIVDAFSSDAVPVHLMTAESLRLYRAKLTDTGIAVLHISNRYLDLDGVLGATAPLVEGLHGLILSDDESDGSYASSTSTVAVFARSAEALEPFRSLNEVRDLEGGRMRPWTDDYSDILGPFLAKLKK